MNTLMRALLITTVGCVGDVASNPGVDAGMGETAPPDAAGACGNVMTSHDNCGACGHACNSVESCTGGKCGDSSEELVDVSAGEDSVCVVTRGGKVFCWGGNSLGELGVDSGTSQCAGAEPCSPTPLEVKGISDAVHVSVGDRHACALRASRTVVCWGRNDLGQLGHASSLDGLCGGTPCGRVPVEVASLSDVDGVSAFGSDTCAITRGGAVLCWGNNAIGLLGIGSVTPASSSTPLMVTATGATSLAVGSIAGPLCEIKSGSLACWGSGATWSLGVDPTSLGGCTCSMAPLANPLVFSVAAAGTSSGAGVALKSTGEVVAWGNRSYGVHTAASDQLATAVPGLPSANSIGVGQTHACAVASGNVWCWGTSSSGELGNGSTMGDLSVCQATYACTRTATKTAVSATMVSAGRNFTVAISARTAWAWGASAVGQLGHPLAQDQPNALSGKCNPNPSPVIGLPGVN